VTQRGGTRGIPESGDFLRPDQKSGGRRWFMMIVDAPSREGATLARQDPEAALYCPNSAEPLSRLVDVFFYDLSAIRNHH
jgi:hypothetical protein